MLIMYQYSFILEYIQYIYSPAVSSLMENLHFIKVRQYFLMLRKARKKKNH